MIRYRCGAGLGSLLVLGLACGCSDADRGPGSGLNGNAGEMNGGAGGLGGAPGAGGQGGAAGASLPDAGPDAPACARFVTGVVAHRFGPGQDTNQHLFPGPILGPPRGAGCCEGSLDVVSIGNGGSVTLEFEGSLITDAPGPDFIVFENAFNVGNEPSQVFAELGTVEVSEDGTNFYEFPCTSSAYPYGGCAGWHPVFANADDNAIDPLDPALAGGDAFDLAELGIEHVRYVRITDRADQTGLAGVFDLDAVGIINLECE